MSCSPVHTDPVRPVPPAVSPAPCLVAAAGVPAGSGPQQQIAPAPVQLCPPPADLPPEINTTNTSGFFFLF